LRSIGIGVCLALVASAADARRGGGVSRSGFGERAAATNIAQPGGGHGGNRGFRNSQTPNRGNSGHRKGHWNGNTNVDRNVNRDVDPNWNGNWNGGGYGWRSGGWGYPVARAAAWGTAAGLTAAAVGSVAYSLPAGCTASEYGGTPYYDCDGTWYQPSYRGTEVTYTVVNPPA